VKTQNIEFQKRTSQRTRRKMEPSDKSCDLPPQGRIEKALGHEGRRQPENECSAAHAADELREVYFRCKCRFEGTLSLRGTDFKMSAEQKSGVVRFVCPNCGRSQQYDRLTGTIKTKKGIWGILLERFS